MNSYLIIKVEGKIIEKFILRCKKNNINLLKIERISNKGIIIKINSKDYENLNKIKSIYTLTIINNEGYLKFKEELNKNKVFIIMAILGLLFLIYLSNTIFSVNIISMNKGLNEKIIKELDSYGIKKYHLKKSYDSIEKIKKKITDKYKDSIEWIEITDIGTKYEVKIVERKKQNNNVSTEYTNVVAKKSGVIKKIYAEDGLKMVEPNTYVNKGDVIISGAITKDEEVKKYVHAKGKVYAEVWYDVSIEFPLKYTEKKYTNNNKRSFYIKIGKDYISRKKYKNFERKKIISLKNRLVPFEVGIESQKEIKIISDTYNINEAKIKAKEKVKEKILQSLDKDEYILDEKTLNFYQKDSKIVLDMFITCYEEIGKEEKIEPITEE